MFFLNKIGIKNKDAVIDEYKNQVTLIEQKRTDAVKALEAQKIELDKTKAQLDSLTAAQAKEKLSPETAAAIDDIKDQAVQNIVSRLSKS